MKEAFKHILKIVLNLGITLSGIILVVVLFPKLIVFFSPILIGLLISRIANPLVLFLEEKMKIRRKAVTAFVMASVVLGIFFLIYAIGSFLIHEFVGFIQTAPEMWEEIRKEVSNVGNSMSQFYDRLPIDLQSSILSFTDTVSTYVSDNISKLSTPTVTALSSAAKNIPSMLVSIIMCILSAYFFIEEKDYLINLIRVYTPKSVQDKWFIIYNSLIKALGGYLKAQLKIGIWMYLLLLIGLGIFKVKYVVLVALGIAVLDFLPIFGTGTVLVPWAVIKIFGGDYKMAIGLLALWGVGQLLRQIIQPKIVGDTLGISPIPTLILLFCGWKVGGVFGMILAVPIGIIVWNLNKAGVFDVSKESLAILIRDINAFRTYTKRDKSYYKHFKKEEDDEVCK